MFIELFDLINSYFATYKEVNFKISIIKVLECKSCWLFLINRWNWYFQAIYEVLRVAYIMLSFIGSSFRDDKMNCSAIDVNHSSGCKQFSTKIINVRKRLYFFQIPRKQPQKVRTDSISRLHYFHLNYFKQYRTLNVDMF